MTFMAAWHANGLSSASALLVANYCLNCAKKRQKYYVCTWVVILKNAYLKYVLFLDHGSLGQLGTLNKMNHRNDYKNLTFWCI